MADTKPEAVLVLSNVRGLAQEAREAMLEVLSEQAGHVVDGTNDGQLAAELRPMFTVLRGLNCIIREADDAIGEDDDHG